MPVRSLWLLACLLPLTLSAQYATVEQVVIDPAHRPVITGQFVNRPADWAGVRVVAEWQPLTSQDFRVDTVGIAADGSFRLVGHHPLPLQQVDLSVGDWYFRLLTTDSLHVTFDVAKMRAKESVIEQFSGPGAVTNRYFEQFFVSDYRAYRDRLYPLLPIDIPGTDAWQGVQGQLALTKSTVDTIYRDFTARHPGGGADAVLLYDYLLAEYVYRPLAQRLNLYLSQHPEARADVLAEPFVEKLIAWRPTVWNTDAAEVYVNLGYVLFGGPFDTTGVSLAKTRDYFLLLMTPEDPVNLALFAEEIIPMMSIPWMVEHLKAQVRAQTQRRAQIERQLASAQVSGELSGLAELLLKDTIGFYVVEDTDVAALIGTLQRAAYRGVLYDFWAPWCGPCLSDWKTGKASKRALRAARIPTVYLCTPNNTTRADWQQTAISYQQYGLHIYLSAEAEVKLRQLFDATDSGYPEYVLVDSRGRIHQDAFNQLVDNWDIPALLRSLDR